MNSLSSVGIFAVVWLAVMILAGIFYFHRYDEKLRTPLLPACLLVVFLPFLLIAIREGAWTILPIVVLGMIVFGLPFLLLRCLRYCKSCGERNYVIQWWSRTRSCAACGKPLDMPKEWSEESD
jgi:hypothetical protein